MAPTDPIARVRSFNRGWTEVLGLLDKGLLATEYSLVEARVIFELAQRHRWERLELRKRLGLDASFLTRVLRRLQVEGLVVSTPSEADGRALDLSLTDAGRQAFHVLDRRSSEQIRELLRDLSADQVAQMVESMAVVSTLIGPSRDEPQIDVRGLAAGDLGWVVKRHGEIYFDEYGWNIDFEALVARVVADYQDNLRVGRENAWVTQVEGARAGCVFCCERDPDTAQLRLLLVEPWARGLGIGTMLVDACTSFARRAGYPKMMLWTNDVLVSARRIYEAAGFVLVEEEPHRSFGHDLIGQNWELDLS
jgi:DNA-binding MarR family transcriptional regulator/GNAT superfamily N-acetyltransferase